MKSMTGFGRSECEAEYGKITAEVQSVNRKYLEVYVSLPKEFSQFEISLRKLVSEKVQRGFVSVRIHLIPNFASMHALLPDVTLLDHLKRDWVDIATKLGFSKESIDLPFLMQQIAQMPQIKRAHEEDWGPLEKCLHQALQALDEMKRKEGAALAKDLAERLQTMAKALALIEQFSPDAVAKVRLKLKERLEELAQPGVELDDRLLREVAIFAERVDIAEELVRFKSHTAQFEELLRTPLSQGKKMDFLIQEMGREINTIGSKAMDAKIAAEVVTVKAELERMREQIQNIE